MSDSNESKTLALLYIAKILYTQTDSDHKMTQAELLDKLDKNHNIAIERKTVGRHLDALRTMGFDVVTSPRGSWWREESRTFSDGELRYLIDSVLFSKHLSNADAENLMRKLRAIGSISMQNKTRFVANAVQGRSVDEKVFDTVDRIAQAIAERKQIKFSYSHYDLKLCLQPQEGTIIVSPLRLVPHNGHYYLVAQQEGNASYDFYRVERMSDVYGVDAQSDEPIKIAEIDDYLRTHPFLSTGESEYCEVILATSKLDDFVDTFGTDLGISKQSDALIKVYFQANPNDLYTWAIQNSVFTEVIKPTSVRTRLRSVSTMLKIKYSHSNRDSYDYAISHARISSELILDHINLAGFTEHRSLTGCKAVTLIDAKIPDVDFLQDFKELQSVCIADTPIKGLGILANKEHLYKLVLRNTNVWDLRFLRYLPNLKILWLINNASILNYDVIYELPGLRQLVIDPTVELDESRIQAEIIRDTENVLVGGTGFPRFAQAKMLLLDLFREICPFSPRDIPAVYTEEKNRQFYDFAKSILNEDDFDLLYAMYNRTMMRNPRYSHWGAERRRNEKDRILDILKRPENLNTILQIYFA